VAGGYSDEPDEIEMKRAFHASLAVQVGNALELVAEASGPEAVEKIRGIGSDRFAIRGFRKLDCARADAKIGYVCSFAVNLELMNGTLERHLKGRFAPASTGLAFAEEI
jgi:hypothetical protein